MPNYTIEPAQRRVHDADARAFARQYAHLIPLVLKQQSDLLMKRLQMPIFDLTYALTDELAQCEAQYRNRVDNPALQECLIFHLRRRLICEMHKNR